MVRTLLTGVGLIMLVLGLNNLFTGRAHFVNSNPEHSKSLYAPPTAVTVAFSDGLAPESTISVVSTISLKPSGELSYSEGEKVRYGHTYRLLENRG